MKLLVVSVAALLLVSGCAAQNNFTRVDSGIPHTAAATAQSKQLTVTGNGGCATFTYTPGKTPGFNYSSGLGVPTTLPGDCKLTDLTITKQYVAGSCPDTRANNYAVSSLNIVNKCSGDEINAADTTTCNNVISKAPDAAKATSGLGQGDIVDSGNTCWEAPTVYYFVKNDCVTAIPVTIKVYFDTYFGTCVAAADTDDGGDDVGGAVPSSGGGGLSSGAKAGIAVGAVAGAVAAVAGVGGLIAAGYVVYRMMNKQPVPIEQALSATFDPNNGADVNPLFQAQQVEISNPMFNAPPTAEA